MSRFPVLWFFCIISFIACLYIIFPLPKVNEVSVQPQDSIIFQATLPDEKIVVKEPNQIKDSLAQLEKNKKEVSKKITKADKIIAYAKTKLDMPYKQAGTTDKGYDCSGLVMTSFKKEKFNLPRASYQMAKKGKTISQNKVKKGDLIFFATNPDKPKKINHVGLVVQVSEGVIYFIHSSTKRGVIISNTSEQYYKDSFIKIRRVLKDE